MIARAPVWGQSWESSTCRFLPVQSFPAPSPSSPPFPPLSPFSGGPINLRGPASHPQNFRVSRQIVSSRCLHAPNKRDLHPHLSLLAFLASCLPGEAEMGGQRLCGTLGEPPGCIGLCLSRGLFGRLSPRSPLNPNPHQVLLEHSQPFVDTQVPRSGLWEKLAL